jgi:hypothetical protein
MQEAPVRRLNNRDRYLFENPDFLSSWLPIFEAACKSPDWWPARNTAIVLEWMVSERHWKPSFCSGSQSLQTRRVKSGQIVNLLHPYTPFCCNRDNVAFVLFFHNSYSLSRLANVVLSKNGQSMKEKLGAEREPALVIFLGLFTFGQNFGVNHDRI